MDNQLERLDSMSISSLLVMDADRINWDDIEQLSKLGMLRGGIIRCFGDPRECVMPITWANDDSIGCIAGWISDE